MHQMPIVPWWKLIISYIIIIIIIIIITYLYDIYLYFILNETI
jgi:hypothetical protein